MVNARYGFAVLGVAAGLTLAAIAIVVEAYFDGGAFAGTLFWLGWAIMSIAMVAGLVVVETTLPLARPLKVAAVGMATVLLALIMETVSGESMMTLWRVGALVMLVGIGWGLWAIGGRR